MANTIWIGISTSRPPCALGGTEEERKAMSPTGLKIDIADFVAVVALDNPPRNAQSLEMMEAITAAFDEMNDRDDVRAVVLTGTGETFSAGVDLKQRVAATAAPAPGYQWRRARAAREKSYAVLECKKPVISAINGPCLGAGLGLASMGDILVASQNAV